jgi:hypothetical protein
MTTFKISGRYPALEGEDKGVLRIDVAEDGRDQATSPLGVVSGFFQGVNWIAKVPNQTAFPFTGTIFYQYPKTQAGVPRLEGKQVKVTATEAEVELKIGRLESAKYRKAQRISDFGTLTVDFDIEKGVDEAMVATTIEEVKARFRDAGLAVSEYRDQSVKIEPPATGNWTEESLHDVMERSWEGFQDNPQWAIWVFFAKTFQGGPDLGGIMFDSEEGAQRQGCSIYVDSFIKVPQPGANRQRILTWTTIHEMGHCFNLAHAFQKDLPTFGTKWIESLGSNKNSLSFMNYPEGYPGGIEKYWRNFAGRFDEMELLFLRHAPREFVQPGAEAWFTNHALTSHRSDIHRLIQDMRQESFNIQKKGQALNPKDAARLALIEKILANLHNTLPLLQELDQH